MKSKKTLALLLVISLSFGQASYTFGEEHLFLEDALEMDTKMENNLAFDEMDGENSFEEEAVFDSESLIDIIEEETEAIGFYDFEEFNGYEEVNPYIYSEDPLLSFEEEEFDSLETIEESSGKEEPEMIYKDFNAIEISSEKEDLIDDETEIENRLSEMEYDSDPIIVPQGTEIDISDANSNVTITNCPVEIVEGSTFIVYFQDLPIAYKALAVITENEHTIVIVEKAEREIFEDFNEEGTIELKPEDYVFVPAKGVYLASPSTDTGDTDLNYADGKLSLVTSYGGSQTQIYLSNLRLSHSLSNGNTGIDLSGNWGIESALNVSTKFFEDLPLGEIRIAGVGKIGISLSMSQEMSMTGVFTGTFSAGITIDQSGFGQAYKRFTVSEKSVTGKGSIIASLKIFAGVDILVAAADVYAEIGLETQYTDKSSRNVNTNELIHCQDFRYYLFLTVGAEAKYFSFLSGNMQTLLSTEFDLIGANESPFYFQVHFENGELVNSCSQGMHVEDLFYGGLEANFGSTISNDNRDRILETYIVLDRDMIVDQDLIISHGGVDLNGHSLTVEGNLIQENGTVLIGTGLLNITGDYRIQSIEDSLSNPISYGDSSGCLKMLKSSGVINIGGDFIVQTSSDQNKIEEGKININGNFRQFNASNSENIHTFGLIDFGYTVSFVGNAPTHEIYFEDANNNGFCNLELQSDVTVLSDISFVRCYNNGHNLNVLGSLHLYHDYDLQGADLIVNGDLTQTSIGHGSIIYLNGGEIIVGGNYKLGASTDFIMQNDADVLRVKGDFIHAIDYNPNITNKTKGTMYVGGDFKKTGRVSFNASGSHKLVFNGSETQKIDINTDAYNYFANVEFINPNIEIAGTNIPGFELNEDINLTISTNELHITGGILKLNGHAIGLERIDGDFAVYGSIYFGGTDIPAIDGNLTASTANLGGKTLIVNGDMTHTGDLNIAQGHLIVNGNLTQKSTSIIYLSGGEVTIEGNYTMENNTDFRMQNDADVLRVNGDFIQTMSSNSYSTEKTKGTMYVGGDFKQTGSVAFKASGSHTLVLCGDEGKQNVTLSSSDSIINILVLTREIDNYVFNPNPCWREIIVKIEEESSFSLANDTWYFGNPTSLIPVGIYRMFLDDATAKQIQKDTDNGKNGHCAGMVLSASSVYKGFPTLPLWGGKVKLGNVNKSDYSSETGCTAIDFIDYAHAFQYTPAFQDEIKSSKSYITDTSNLDGLRDAVFNFQHNNGEPVWIRIGFDRGGHALLGYEISEETDSETQIAVYDCNRPGEKSYIILTGKYGNYTGARFIGSLDWNLDTEKYNISYVIQTHNFIKSYDHDYAQKYTYLKIGKDLTGYLIFGINSRIGLRLLLDNDIQDIIPIQCSNEIAGIDSNAFWLNAGNSVSFTDLSGEGDITLAEGKLAMTVDPSDGSDLSIDILKGEAYFSNCEGGNLSIKYELSSDYENSTVTTIKGTSSGVSQTTQDDMGNIIFTGIQDCNITLDANTENADGTTTTTALDEKALSELDPSKEYIAYEVQNENLEIYEDQDGDGSFETPVSNDANIKVSETSVTLCSGFSRTINLSNLAVGDEVVSWTSADETIAAVDINGTIEGINQGETIVTVTLLSGLTADVAVKVGHTVVVDNAVSANCLKPGLTEGSHCSVCGEIITAQEEVPKAAHTVVTDKAVAATCTTVGKTEGSHCSVCGTVLTAQKEVSATGHKWDGGKVTKYATTVASGVKTYTCSVCGETKTESLPKLSEKEAEGDVNDPASVAGTEKAMQEVKDSGEPKGSSFALIQLQSRKQTKNSITLTWNKVKDADGYIIFGNRCGTKYTLKRITKITSNKFVYKKLKKGTYYKFTVSAYKIVNGREQVIATSKMIHVATKGGKVTNVKNVSATVKKKNVKKISLKINKSVTITPKTAKEKSKLKLKNHRKIKYESSNPVIATVSANGKVTAKKNGICYIYVYSQTGVFAKVKVTVG